MKVTWRGCAVWILAGAALASPIQAQPVKPAAPSSKPLVGELSEEVVRARLASAGYGEVKKLQREGEFYVVDTSRANQPVQVKINAMTGQISDVNK
jgi:hypothetical protein